MKTNLKFVTLATPSRMGGNGAKCRCQVVHADVVAAEDIAADMAETMRLDIVDARHFASVVTQYVVRSLAKGKKLNFGPFSISLSIRGTVDGANGEFDEERNSVNVNIQAGRELKDALGELHPVNVTVGENAPRIVGVADTATKREDTVTPGATVFVSGSGLDTPVDGASEDEGLWLEKDGERIARGRVTASTSTTLDCVFDAAEGVRGDMMLALYTRGGDASQSGCAVARRAVSVRMPTLMRLQSRHTSPLPSCRI